MSSSWLSCIQAAIRAPGRAGCDEERRGPQTCIQCVFCGAPPSRLPELDSARAYATAARSDATLRLYTREWSTFFAWREALALASLPASPGAVVCYVASMADAGGRPRASMPR